MHGAEGFLGEGIQVVAIAASMGGIQALGSVLQDLPADFPVPILIVMHLSAQFPSVLDQILQPCSSLRVQWASDREWLKAGTVYLAPPDRHLTVSAPGLVSLKATERVNWVRPAADVLFESVARHYGKRSLGVVLTGTGHDGTAGSVCIKKAGGWVLAQDEESSRSFDMPRSAIGSGAVDYVLSLENLSFAILSLVMTFGATSLFRIPQRLAAAA
jgi:two-component system chemotaxis response regulator CheB